ncbi:MAG: trypsin-like peptidase domain-containing protein [Anaplasmataceae bacterium]|nr:trypsin-like peptidase domain-containing protein [Anaplasmataceae bacterium]
MLQRRITRAIRHIMPAVVSVVISKHLEDIEKEVPHELSHLYRGSGKNKKMAIPESLIDDRGMVRIGGGSGFLVSSKGLILTNKHVVSDAKAEHTIIIEGLGKYEAQVLSRDPVNDVAILQVKESNLPYVALGNACELQLGELVVAIGNALGLFKNTVSLGIVSGLSRSVIAQAEDGATQEMRGLIQTDAAINLGNSGGPLVTLDGRVVGINTATVAGADGIGFAIPINAAKRDLDDLKKFGEIRRPLLGVRYMTVDARLSGKLRLPAKEGALIIHEGPEKEAVLPKSPADEAGLKEWDIILTFNGEKITKDKPLGDYLNQHEAGDKVKLTVQRGDKTLTVKLTLDERR